MSEPLTKTIKDLLSNKPASISVDADVNLAELSQSLETIGYQLRYNDGNIKMGLMP